MAERERILIVDDNENVCRSLALILERRGYEADWVLSGQEALQKAQAKPFDLALIDIRLPDMAGIELLTPLKEIHPDIVPVMSTAYASLETALQALNAGAAAYIIKPVKVDEVLLTIQGALEKQRLIRENRRLYEAARRELAERRLAERARRESEEQYRALVESFSDHVFILSCEGTYLASNRRVEHLNLRADQSLIGLRVRDVYPPQVAALYGEQIQRVLLTGKAVEFEHAMEGQDGQHFYVDTLYPIYRDGEIRAVGGICRDITQRKRAEEALRQHAERLRFLHEMDQAILEARSPQEIAAVALRQLRGLLPCRWASVVLFNPQSNTGTLLAVQDGDETQTSAAGRLELDACWIEPLSQEGLYEIGDLAAIPDPPASVRALRKKGLRSFVSVALLAHGELIGSLNLAAEEPQAFSLQDVEIMREVAGPLAIAIEDARLLEAERQRSEELSHVNALITALSQVAARMEASPLGPEGIMAIVADQLKQLGIFSSVALLDPTDGTPVLQYVSLEPEVADMVEELLGAPLRGYRLPRGRWPKYAVTLARGRALFLPDLATPAAAILSPLSGPIAGRILELCVLGPDTPGIAVPLSVGNSVLGILIVWSRRLREADTQPLSVFASQMAIALQNARLLETIRKHREELQRLSAQVIHAQEDERTRISRELHDELGQALTGLCINLAEIDKQIGAEVSPGIRGRLLESRALADQVLEQIRELALELHPSILDDLGLAPALRWYANTYSRRTAVRVDLEAMEADARLPAEIATALYRIVQEALTNVAKHAQAKRVAIRLRCEPSEVRLTIEDDGRGFDAQRLAGGEVRPGAGLVGIRERVALLGGSFGITSAPGQGTQLDIAIPRGQGS